MPRARKSNITKVSMRFYDGDIKRLKRRAAEDGASTWHDVARRLLHAALDAPAAAPANVGKVFKFIIATDTPDADDPAISWSGMTAAAIAETEAEAREIVRKASAAVGRDARWLAVADVVILPCAAGTFITQAAV
jgi:plasmid stability protein